MIGKDFPLVIADANKKKLSYLLQKQQKLMVPEIEWTN